MDSEVVREIYKGQVAWEREVYMAFPRFCGRFVNHLSPIRLGENGIIPEIAMLFIYNYLVAPMVKDLST